MKLKDRFKKLLKKNKESEGKRKKDDNLEESARPKNRLYLVVEDVDKVNE